MYKSCTVDTEHFHVSISQLNDERNVSITVRSAKDYSASFTIEVKPCIVFGLLVTHILEEVECCEQEEVVTKYLETCPTLATCEMCGAVVNRLLNHWNDKGEFLGC